MSLIQIKHGMEVRYNSVRFVTTSQDASHGYIYAVDLEKDVGVQSMLPISELEIIPSKNIVIDTLAHDKVELNNCLCNLIQEMVTAEPKKWQKDATFDIASKTLEGFNTIFDVKITEAVKSGEAKQPKFLFRPQKGKLNESSLADLVELDHYGELLYHLNVFYDQSFDENAIKIEPYSFEEKTGWDANVVLYKGRPVGFTNKMVNESDNL
jgi:hypothetical protein